MNDHLFELNNIPDLHYKAIDYVFENKMVIDDGLWLEFGVYVGGTINRISKMTQRNCVFGFDSFEGLPEDWYGRTDYTFSKGTFNLNSWMPKVPLNCTLVKGWFKDTLPLFIQDHKEKIMFLHIDSDIYSSAKDIFHYLGRQIGNDCIIVFDELIEYPGFEFNEWKAWWEFVEENNITFEWIGGNRSKIIHPQKSPHGIVFASDYPEPKNVSPPWENVAVKITNNPLFKG